MRTSLGALFSLFLVGCTPTIDGNGHLVEESRGVREFRGVRVENGLNVRAELGSPGLRLWLDENLLEYVVAKVERGDLVLRTKDGVSLDASAGARIYVRSPVIEAVDLSEGSSLDGEIGGDDHGYVTLEASGGSDIDVTVYAKYVSVDASGSSDVDLRGAARELSVDASGESVIRSEMRTEILRVDASGGSDIRANASESATVEASGGSDVTVYGSPKKRNVDTSGGSDVRFR
jgi:hypothetical protein